MSKPTPITFTKMSGNAKLKDYKNGYVFSLPAGHSCPAAKLCRASCDRKTGKLTQGKHTVFRCFGASIEAYSSALRKCVWRNFDALRKARTPKAIADLLDSYLPGKAEIVRIHGTGGDFYNADYLKGWVRVAERRPDTVFYCYSKRPDLLQNVWLPANMRVSLSWGGTHDGMIPGLAKRYPSVRVVYTKAEARRLKLPLDHDDKYAIAANRDFALLIHGAQTPGSEASKAMKALKARGIKSGYSHD